MRSNAERLPTGGAALAYGLVWFGAACLLTGCVSTDVVRERKTEQFERLARKNRSYTERGVASWYGPQFHGRRTASGERFDMEALSAAHRYLPFGTVIEVHNLDNDRKLELTVNDRGPFVRGRILDLSKGAADRLGVIGPGLASVEIRVVHWPEGGAVVIPATERTSSGGTPRAPTAVAPVREVWLQLGAFRDFDRALTLAIELRALDERWDVYADDGWYRVQLRDLAGRDEAMATMRRLEMSGYQPILLEQR